MASTRCGISAKQIERETGVTYKTAWRMFRKIRMLLTEEDSKLSGKVEMDETYSVSQKYLQSYLDEYSFRYNHRSDTQPMFTTFLRQISKA